MAYRYFNEEQDPKMLGVKKEVIQMLDKARGFANIPFIITSGFRTNAESEAVGGFAGDTHTRGLACDIACANSNEAFLMVWAGIMAGCCRFGLGKGHVHFDLGIEEPQKVLFIEK